MCPAHPLSFVSFKLGLWHSSIRTMVEVRPSGYYVSAEISPKNRDFWNLWL
jgi:hypothetical protein